MNGILSMEQFREGNPWLAGIKQIEWGVISHIRRADPVCQQCGTHMIFPVTWSIIYSFCQYFLKRVIKPLYITIRLGMLRCAPYMFNILPSQVVTLVLGCEFHPVIRNQSLMTAVSSHKSVGQGVLYSLTLFVQGLGRLQPNLYSDQ